MIDLVGPDTGPERAAAEWLRDGLLSQWPDLARSRGDQIRIHAAAKLFGYRVQDLDVLLLAQFAERREFRPITVFRPSAGEPVRPRWASVGSLALIIEVKGHDARNVRFDGQTVSVRYRRGGEESWENASEQSWEQVHALRRYLLDQGLSGIWFTGLILFSNLRESDLPPRPHNFLGGDTSFEQLLNSLGEIANPWIRGNRAIISAGPPERVAELFQRPLFRSLEPTPLDRRRMDRIATQGAHRSGWFEELGEKRIILTGRGGAGKTVILLQLAHRSYDENGARSLILTYNRALIADMRRTLGLMGITSSPRARGDRHRFRDGVRPPGAVALRADQEGRRFPDRLPRALRDARGVAADRDGHGRRRRRHEA